MANLPTPKRPDKQSGGLFGRKIALGAWVWGNDGTFGNNLTAESLKPIFDTAMECFLQPSFNKSCKTFLMKIASSF